MHLEVAKTARVALVIHDHQVMRACSAPAIHLLLQSYVRGTWQSGGLFRPAAQILVYQLQGWPRTESMHPCMEQLMSPTSTTGTNH